MHLYASLPVSSCSFFLDYIVRVGRERSSRSFFIQRECRSGINLFVYRLTFRWPKSDFDVDNSYCTSKYYLLLAIVC